MPPALSIIGGVAQAGLTGSADPLRKVAPLLVPGGIAASRLAGIVPGTQGVPLLLKKADVRAMQLRRDVPRIEKILATLPKEMRSQFALMLQMAVFSEGSNFLGVDPHLLSQGTPNSRMSQRQGFPSGLPIGNGRSGTYQGNMSPLSSLDLGGLGRNQLPRTGVGQGLQISPFGRM